MNEPTNISCISSADRVQCIHMFLTMFLDTDSIHPHAPFFSKFPFLLAENSTNFLSMLICFAKVFWKWCMMLSVISYSQLCSLLFTFFFIWFFFFPHRAEDVFPLFMWETSVMAEFLSFFFSFSFFFFFFFLEEELHSIRNISALLKTGEDAVEALNRNTKVVALNLKSYCL